MSGNGRLGRLRSRHASETLLRSEFAQLAGLQYDEDRDIYKVAGYPTEYDFATGWSRYKRQGVAKRIVDLLVNKTWRHKPEILDGEDDETEFTEAWNHLWDDLSLMTRFSQVDRMAAIGEFAILLLGFTDATTDRDMAEPVDPSAFNGELGLAYVRGYKQKDVTVKQFVTEPNDPRHGLPDSYTVDLGGGEGARKRQRSLGSVIVHHTRVLHVVEDPLDSDVYGIPRLQPVVNTLIDWEKAKAGSAEALWQLAARILFLDIDEKADVKQDDLDDLEDDLLNLVHDLRRHWIGQGMELNWLDGEVPDPTGVAELIKVAMAVDSGIPKRVLFGTETGERASEQDERAFLGTVGERIEQYAEPVIVRGFTDRMIDLGVLPEPSAGTYLLRWRPLFELSEMQKAEVNKTNAETANTLTAIGGDPREVAEITEEGEVRLVPTVGLGRGESRSRRRRRTRPRTMA